MKFRHTYFFLIATVALFLASCGSSPQSQKVSQRVKDREAFALGEEHAAQLIDVSSDESAVQEKLLEVRARISNIGEKVGLQSAADYERGFTRYISANNDSLARILF